jgi:hypothetical protein
MLQESFQIFFQVSSKAGTAADKFVPDKLKALAAPLETVHPRRLIESSGLIFRLPWQRFGLPCQPARLYGIVQYPSRMASMAASGNVLLIDRFYKGQPAEP